MEFALVSMGTQLAAKRPSSPQSPKASTSQPDVLITSATQKRKRGRPLRASFVAARVCTPQSEETLVPWLADPALVSPTVKRNCRIEAGPSSNPRSLAKIFSGSGQVILKDRSKSLQACGDSCKMEVQFQYGCTVQGLIYPELICTCAGLCRSC